MNVRNDSGRSVTTWKGVEIAPGETKSVDVSDAEAGWLLRHGCADADAKEKRARTVQASHEDAEEQETKRGKGRGRVREK
jgi:hypothetical protein